MKFKFKRKLKLRAFTLTELLVVLVIMGILILMALPNLMPLVSNAHKLEARIGLAHLHKLQKVYYSEHLNYSDSFESLAFETDKTVDEGGKAVYRYEIVESSGNSYVAIAEALRDFDGDGTLNKWQIDESGKLKELVND